MAQPQDMWRRLYQRLNPTEPSNEALYVEPPRSAESPAPRFHVHPLIEPHLAAKA